MRFIRPSTNDYANLPPLNVDIILSVLDHFRPPPALRVPSARQPTTTDRLTLQRERAARVACLARFCLVSKQWLDPSRKLLYYDLYVEQFEPKILTTLANHPELQLFAQRLFVSYYFIDIAHHLFKHLSNLTSIWMEGKTSHHDMSQFFHSRQMTHLVISDHSSLTDAEWIAMHNSWPHLRTLTFDGSSPEFYDCSQFRPFASLQTLEYARTDVDIASLPAILPHTLDSFKLHHVFISGSGAIPFMLRYHSQSLRRLEVVGCYGNVDMRAVVRALEPVAALRTLKLYKNPPASFELTELPESLVAVTVDLPSCLPGQVLELVEERGVMSGGQLRSLSVGVGYHFDDLDWEKVKLMAKTRGVKFSIRRLFVYPDSDT